MTAPVFISYASADQAITDEICAELEIRKFPCWIAHRDVPPSENFGEVIVRSISAAKVMVLVFSDRANRSDEIKKELVLAGRSHIPVIPLRIENVEPSGAFAYELGTRQRIDFFADRDKAIERLCRQIEQIIGTHESSTAMAPVDVQEALDHGDAVYRIGEFANALSWYRRAAGQNSAVAQNRIGWIHQNGLGLPQDHGQALIMYRRAADQNLAEAQYNLAYLYEKGLGVPQNYGQASTWYRKAAEHGFAPAQNNIGDLYYNGLGVEHDYAQALAWFRKAADQNEAGAQNSIGWLYQNGFGVARDHRQALIWFRKAADNAYPAAQSSIGWFYKHGIGVAQDHGLALAWFRKAADQGYAVAQSQIGWLYNNGVGVPRDDEQALDWYRKLADDEPAVRPSRELFYTIHDALR